MNLNQNLKTKLDAYISLLNEAHPTCVFTYTVGRKYIRVIQCWGSSQSSFCFVDLAGNLYKCDSWAKPAVGIRGHIDKPILELEGFYRG